MPVAETNASFDALQRRHPRILRAIAWLRMHPVLCSVAGSIGIAAVFLADVMHPEYLVDGLYAVPLLFLALAVHWRAVAFAVAVAVALSALVFFWEGPIDADRWLLLLYFAAVGAALVMVSYLIRRLTTATEHAVLRAQLFEAGADVLGGGGSGDDLDQLLVYALDRLGEQLEAGEGVLLLLEGDGWRGRAGFGLGMDPREFTAPLEEVPLAAQALRADEALTRDFAQGDPSPLAPLAVHLRLEHVLVLPMRSLEREVGVLVYNRRQDAGEYSGEQITLGEGLARYLGVTVDNVRLMAELERRRRDLELVRDSSLDFAQSGDVDDLLQALTARLVEALDVPACEIHEVDAEAGVLRTLVSYDDGVFDTTEWRGREYPIDDFATNAMAIRSRRPVIVASREDPRLNRAERDLMSRFGYNAELVIPLRIRERVLALAELRDRREGRDFSDEEVELARSICRFAGLAIEKARIFAEVQDTAERRDRLARRSTAPTSGRCLTRSRAPRSTCSRRAVQRWSRGPAAISWRARWWSPGARQRTSPQPRRPICSRAAGGPGCRGTGQTPASRSSQAAGSATPPSSLWRWRGRLHRSRWRWWSPTRSSASSTTKTGSCWAHWRRSSTRACTTRSPTSVSTPSPRPSRRRS